ncbi:MAG: TetR/AcrR family transcriptional regulator [Rhodoferax sp.]
MPIPIDRAQRTAEVAQVAAQLIAQGGLEAVTFRNLAAVIGCSTTAISHYFPTRNDVLLATYSHVADRARRQRQARPADTGIDVAALLQQILPIGSDKSDDWKVWLCFWTAALFDPRLADLQKTGNAATRDEITQLLRAAGWPAAQARQRAAHLMTTLYGIAIQAIFDPQAWTPRQQHDALQDALQRAAAPAPARKRGGAAALRPPPARRPAPG